MHRVRRDEDRGHLDHGWLDARHSFSFGEYVDAQQRGFRDLIVLNEDRIAPGAGFPTHGHRDAEILTFPLAGTLEHRDSAGNVGRLGPEEVQRMSAGRGIRHSEHNASRQEPLHLLQVWLLPAASGTEPGYEQRAFDPEQRRGRLRLLVSPDGADGSLTIGQDVRVHDAELAAGETVLHALAPRRHAWVQVVAGTLEAGGEPLAAGDGLAVSDERELTIEGGDPDGGRLLLFDLR